MCPVLYVCIIIIKKHLKPTTTTEKVLKCMMAYICSYIFFPCINECTMLYATTTAFFISLNDDMKKNYIPSFILSIIMHVYIIVLEIHIMYKGKRHEIEKKCRKNYGLNVQTGKK